MGQGSLRATREDDLDAVVSLEAAEDTAVWLGGTGRQWHIAALDDEDIAHLCYVSPSGRVDGFGVLAGIAAGTGAVEVRRMVVARDRRGRGDGRRLLELLVERAQRIAGARFVWLDVKDDNQRARALYASSGFVEADPPEGVDAEPGLAYLRRPVP